MCFGWLPHLQDPINIKLTRILREREREHSANSTTNVAGKSFLCEFLTISSKRNRETGSCDDETGVKKMCKGRSTLTVPRIKLTVQRHGGWQARHCETASHKLLQQGNETYKHTHTHTHTHTQRAANCCDFAYATHTHTHKRLSTATISLMLRPIRCYTQANKATVTNF